MAITIPATGSGTTNPPVATEIIGGEHYQLFKLIDGNVGSAAAIGTSANPLRVLPILYTQPITGSVVVSQSGIAAIVGSIGVTQLAGPWLIVGSVVVLTNSALIIEGDTAAGSFDDPGFNPVKIGGYVSDSVSPTRVGSGARVNAWFDASGRQVVRPFGPRGLVVDQFTTLNSSAQFVVMTSGTAGIFYDLSAVVVVNRSPLPVRIDFRDSSASAIHFSVTAPGSAPGVIQNAAMPILIPIQQLNAAMALGWTAQLGSGSTVSNSVNDVQVFVQALKVIG